MGQSLVGHDLAKDLGQHLISETPLELGSVREDVGTVQKGCAPSPSWVSTRIVREIPNPDQCTRVYMCINELL